MEGATTSVKGDRVGKVLIPRPFDEPFDYLIPEGLEIMPGQWVKVPFGRSTVAGCVWLISAAKDSPYQLKSIEDIFDVPPLNPAFIQFLNKMAEYTLSPLGALLKLVLPQSAFLQKPERGKSFTFEMPDWKKPGPQLSFHQNAAASALKERIAQSSYSTVLLDGVTGSGKTEVYFEAIRAALEAGGRFWFCFLKLH